MNDNLLATRGIRRVIESPDGAINETVRTWPGVLAILLRKIIKDNYVGKNVEGCIQHKDESLMYSYLEELIENYIKTCYGNDITEAEIKSERTRLLNEFSRDGISIKVLGEFLMVMNPEWADITITLQRPSGITKAYTVHIGGMGYTDYTPPQYTEAQLKEIGAHDTKLAIKDTSVTKKVASKRSKKGNKDAKD